MPSDNADFRAYRPGRLCGAHPEHTEAPKPDVIPESFASCANLAMRVDDISMPVQPAGHARMPGRVGLTGLCMGGLRLSCHPEVLVPPRPYGTHCRTSAKRGMFDRRRHAPAARGYRRSQSIPPQSDRGQNIPCRYRLYLGAGTASLNKLPGQRLRSRDSATTMRPKTWCRLSSSASTSAPARLVVFRYDFDSPRMPMTLSRREGGGAVSVPRAPRRRDEHDWVIMKYHSCGYQLAKKCARRPRCLTCAARRHGRACTR